VEWLQKKGYFDIQLHSFVGNNKQLLNKQLNLFIYRLLQECLNNIIKHAKATAITVRVSYDQGELTFSIEDNGVGFDVEMATGIKKGLGLENIRKR
ncbi:ATP-binding protein, partial [Acinetobacter baumannii]